MKRTAVFVLIVLTAVILQTALLSRVRIFGVAPDLVLVLIISLALLEGPLVGAAAGFGGGILRDFLLETPAGLTSLAYLAVGYVVGTVRPYVQSTSVFLPVAAVGAASFVGTVLYALLAFLLGAQADPFGRIARVVVLTSVYNTLLTPFVYPMLRRIASLYPRDRVYRW